MLCKIYIKNFGSIKNEVEININNSITSLIGKNESGKSTLLKAIRKLNGEKIEKEEKNVELKNEQSYIKGLFILEKKEIKEINKKYEATNKDCFYSLPTDYEKLYYSFEVKDDDSTLYASLMYLNENKEYKSVPNSIFADRVVSSIKKIKGEMSKEQKEKLIKLYFLDDIKIKEQIDTNLLNSDLSEDIKNRLQEISSQISKDRYIPLLPKYEFLYFSSFDSILKDTVQFSDIEGNKQALNLLKIANIDLDELSLAYEKNDEQTLEDLGAQCVDVVSKKYKEIFQQTDEDFKIKIRFGSANKNISFLTQDKTSGTRTINLSNRSDGFKWYLSLYLTLYDYICNDGNKRFVLLLDEPNLYLHPGAQNNLLYNVFYNEFNDVQIIYTTHSPYMIDSDNSYSVRIVEKSIQTEVYNSSREYSQMKKGVKDVDTVTPLLTALDLNVTNSIIFDEKDILIAVEGIQDVYILKAMIERTGLNSKFKNIKIIPSTSASKVPYLYSYLYGMGYNVYALFDNDKAGRDAIDNIIGGDLEDDRVNKLLKYDLVSQKKDYLLEDLFSDKDRKELLPSKSTLLYKKIFDERKTIALEEETINNFREFLEKLLSVIE